MAAGQGFKTFTTGEVLTAGDVNGYLMQGINVFASSAARAAAISSPQEGQYSFLKDTNALEYYDGAAWVGAPVGDITAVTAGTGISGGGSSGDVTITNSMATAITTNGDLIYGTGSGTFTRRGIGSTGQVLTVSGGVPTWAAAAAGGSTLLDVRTNIYYSNYSTTSSSFVDVNASLFYLTFTVPASGNVVLRVSQNIELAGTSSQAFLNWREGTTNLTNTEFMMTNNASTNPLAGVVSWSCYLTGLSAGTKTYKLGMRTSGGTFYGYTNSSQFLLEAWSA